MEACRFYEEILHCTDPALIKDLAENSEKRHYTKGDMIVRIGEKQKEICFMETGAFRGYLLAYHGREMTDCFCSNSGDVALAPGPIMPDMVSDLAFEVLEEGDYFCVPIRIVQELLDKYKDAVTVYSRILNESAWKHWELKRVIISCSATQRYQWFLKQYPGLIDSVNNKYIASFLGMTPETLSRQRKAMADDGR